MNNRQQESLDQLLAALPKDVLPSRNLWPGIAQRVMHTRRRTPPLAMAAAFTMAAVCAASLFTWAVLKGHSVPPLIQTVGTAPSFVEPADPRYVLARDSLEKTFRERLKLLEPRTRAQIEASLAVIRQAHEEIRKALASDPASPVLEQLWESTWHDEYDLYDHVVQATQSTMTRI
jgi:hypothetical protein